MCRRSLLQPSGRIGLGSFTRLQHDDGLGHKLGSCTPTPFQVDMCPDNSGALALTLPAQLTEVSRRCRELPRFLEMLIMCGEVTGLGRLTYLLTPADTNPMIRASSPRAESSL